MIEDPSRIEWDVIVVGTGMGGGTMGHALARAGLRVLFVEQGRNLLDPQQAHRGSMPDEAPGLARGPERKLLAALAAGGRSTDSISDVTIGSPKSFTPFIGGGVGGSAALYGMACERLFPCDFQPRQHHPRAVGSSLPESWHVSYDQLVPWYRAAEELYCVSGTADPLRPAADGQQLIAPPPFTPGNAELAGYFAQEGLHPYQLHLACDHHPECATCQGLLCARQCKHEPGRDCVAPAIERHGAELITDCRAWRLDADRARVRKLVCNHQGEVIELRAKRFVLAAGALVTPTLLLRSRSAEWPDGLANRSGQVGRNLMRHAVDMLIVYPHATRPILGQVKELAFNDWYLDDEAKLGTVQSLGPLPPLSYFLNIFQCPAWLHRVLRLAGRGLWRRFIEDGLILASIMEDLPYHDHFVRPSAETSPGQRQQLELSYQLKAYESERLALFRARLAKLLGSYSHRLLRGAEDNKAIAHVCGTCRAGTDSTTSVVNADHRAHDLDNLYIVDASCFPSSGGVNPSLTIAALALRTAQLIASEAG